MRYDFLGFFRLIFSFIYTKLFFPKARLIRLPFDIRNKKYIQIGKNFTSGFNCRIEAIPLSKDQNICISIGDNVQMNDFVHIGSVSSIKIGNYVLMASKIYISDHNHGSYTLQNSDSPLTPPIDRPIFGKEVIIEDNVWIGESVCILPGVTIGKGSIIGALAVVTKDIPPYSIAVGNPAKVIKAYDFENAAWINQSN